MSVFQVSSTAIHPISLTHGEKKLRIANLEAEQCSSLFWKVLSGHCTGSYLHIWITFKIHRAMTYFKAASLKSEPFLSAAMVTGLPAPRSTLAQGCGQYVKGEFTSCPPWSSWSPEGPWDQMFLQQGFCSSVSALGPFRDTALMEPRTTSLLLTFFWISVGK